jgi:5-methyltetrahydrofolate--homocysteine methyltransferase
MEALAAAGVDAVCVETMTDLAEAQLAVRAAKAALPEVPVLATMTFDPTPRGYFTIMGVSVAKAAAGLAEAGADAIGSNCGNGIEHMVALAREFRAASRLPLVIQANAGLPKSVGGRTVYDETPAFLAGKARELLAIGVSVIGGCCGTTPEHIRALRAMVDDVRR